MMVLLNMIHERTMLKPLPTITATNYYVWVKAWFETAEEMHQEFEEEGLFGTCAELRRIIEKEKSYNFEGTPE